MDAELQKWKMLQEMTVFWVENDEWKTLIVKKIFWIVASISMIGFTTSS